MYNLVVFSPNLQRNADAKRPVDCHEVLDEDWVVAVEGLTKASVNYLPKQPQQLYEGQGLDDSLWASLSHDPLFQAVNVRHQALCLISLK